MYCASIRYLWIVAISCVIFGKSSVAEDLDLRFPENFSIGAGASSYQVEGAWNVDGKSENIWDRWTHSNPESTLDGSNGDIASNTYYKYKEDVQRMRSMGFDSHRFSISWSRVLPTGLANAINEIGLQYYKNLTAELVANGIEPIVTLYHWDHPQALEDQGGWTNEMMIDTFVDYARIMFEALGKSVKIWTTFNEPCVSCSLGYDGSEKQHAPGRRSNGTANYICAHNILKAHARAYRMYDEEFRATQQGQIGMTHFCVGFKAANSSDILSADIAHQFHCGWTAHPIYLGDYPEIMKTRIAMISESQGYSKSRLPEFSQEWIDMIKGTSDYFGLNHYSTIIASPDPDEELGIYNTDEGLIKTADPNRPPSFLQGSFVHPAGFGDVLRRIKHDYNNPKVWVMENGYTDDGELKDCDRIRYYYDYLRELFTAVKRDGCNVKGYCLWSYIDCFEWQLGYTKKNGIVSVDFEDPNRTRTDKWSTSWWRRVLATRELQSVPTNCDS